MNIDQYLGTVRAVCIRKIKQAYIASFEVQQTLVMLPQFSQNLCKMINSMYKSTWRFYEVFIKVFEDQTRFHVSPVIKLCFGDSA